MSNPEVPSGQDSPRLVSQGITREELLEILQASNIPIDEYGVGEAKTIEAFLNEINEGEATMTIDNKNVIRREVGVVWLDVLHETQDGTVYILREDRQELKDGRVKRRSLDSSIGEKLKPDETPEVAVARALVEELGIHETDSLYSFGYEEKTFVPPTFPGIESTYKMHKFVSMIPVSAFKPEGYIEYQDDKTNYYVWELLRPDPTGNFTT